MSANEDTNLTERSHRPASGEREPLLSRLRSGSGTRSRTASKTRTPWWRRPAVWWLFPLFAVQTICLAMIVGPTIEMYNRMACKVHRPDIGIEHVRYPGWRDDLPGSSDPPVPLPMPHLPGLLSFEDLSAHGPTKEELCNADKKVQRAVASLLTANSIMVGLITALVTGWWAARSDMWGRTIVCAFGSLTGIVSYLGMIIVAKGGSILPGKQYWWILPFETIGAVFGGAEGFIVGYAYVSDVTEPTNRASAFALLAAVSMGSISIGPVLGAQVIHHTGDLLSVYYIGLALSVVSFFGWLFVVPESLNPDIRTANKAAYHDRRRQRVEEGATARAGTSIVGRLRGFLVPSWLVELVEPLEVLLPRAREEGGPREWGLTILGLALFFILAGAGSTTFLIQLARLFFSWGAEEVGYWLSTVGFSRMLFLLLLFPAINYYLKPKPLPPQDEDEDDEISAAVARMEHQKRAHAVVRTDLLIARVSVIIDTVGYVFLTLSATSLQFTAASAITAFGSGFVPSIRSVALFLAPGGDREVGKVMGAIGVLSSFSAQVCGSALFGLVYNATISVFPRGIMVLATALYFAAFLTLLFVRIPRIIPSTASA